MIRNLLISLFVLPLLLAAPIPASSAVISVSGGCSLIDAITAANNDAVAGGCTAGAGPDTIILEHDVTLTAVEEVWKEFFDIYDFGPSGLPVIRTPIVIEGEDYSIIRQPGSAQFRIFSVAGDPYAEGALTLRNVTLSGGFLDGGGLPMFPANTGEKVSGGAILSIFGDVTIENSVLSGNSADNGGALAIFGATFDIFNSELLINYATLYGGALVSYSSTVVVRRSRFADNEALTAGGAIAINFGMTTDVVDSSFLRNTAMAGGAIYNASATSLLNVVNTLFQDNVFRTPQSHTFFHLGGGALENFNAAKATVRNSQIIGNFNGDAFGFGFGAGIRNEGSGARLTMIDSDVLNNGLGTAKVYEGGGIYIGQGGYLDARGLTIEGNMASSKGGGVAVTNIADAVITASVITANEAGSQGGGIYGQDSEVTLRASRLTDNLAGRNGGGAYMNGNYDPRKMILTVEDSTISGNGDLDSTFGNITGAGLSIEQWSDALITRSTFTGNTGPGSAGFSSAGAGIYVWGPARVDVINNTLAGNDGEPSGGGGAIFSGNHAQVDVAFSTISGNTAWVGGGIRNTAGLSMEGTVLADNIASKDDFDNCSEFFAPTDHGANLADDDSCGGTVAIVSDADLALGALGPNGGATETIMPGAASVAVDYSGAACAVTGGVDQRGAPRDTACDAGAVETGWTLPVIAFETDEIVVIEGLDSGFDVAIVLDNSAGNLEQGQVKVWPKLKGSAAFGWDYTLLDDTSPIVFQMPSPGFSETRLLSFDLNDDNEREGTEELVASFTFAGPAFAGAQVSHLVSILDDDSIGPGACAALQAELQAQMGDEDPLRYRNHGRYVSPVARATGKAVKRAEITQECQDCIVSQFARSIPIAEQTVCSGSSMLIAVQE